MSAVVITGGAGFIGANFVRLALTSTNEHLVIVDKLTYAGHLLNIKEVLDDPRATFVEADIADQSAMERVFSDYRPRAVLNFAAESHVDRSIDSPRPFIDTNIVGTFVLLEIAREYVGSLDQAQKNDFRFLHVSTDEVYGSLGQTGWFSEETPYAPNSPYAASKAAADHLVRAYYHTYGLPILMTNCSNNYGPYQFPEKLIPLMLLNAMEGKPLPIYGNGQQIRDWLHVEDHCEGLWQVLQQGQPGEKYNLGGNNEHTNVQTVDTICRILEDLEPASRNHSMMKQKITMYSQLKKFVEDRPGHDQRYAIDATKMRQNLGWAPRYDFEAGLRHTIKWYLSHRDWCQAVMDHNYGRERLGLEASAH